MERFMRSVQIGSAFDTHNIRLIGFVAALAMTSEILASAPSYLTKDGLARSAPSREGITS
jgi:hypothetical protein